MRNWRAGLVWALAGVSLALWLSGVVLGALSADALLDPAEVGLGATFPIIGALVAARRPRNIIGGLLCAIGFTMALSVFGDNLPPQAFAAGMPWTLPIMWFGWPLPYALLGTFLLLLFPSGTLLSRRWRVVAWSSALGTVALVFSALLMPWTPENAIFRQMGSNPFEGPPPLVNALFVIGASVLVPSVAASVLSVVLHWRRSQGVERQQLKWFALAAIAAFFAYFYGPRFSGPVADALEVVVWLLPGISIGIAILKYRLYDIDVVISKTVVFAGLAGFITAVYVAIVVGVGSLIGAGEEPNLGLSIVATAVVAVAFQPARERLTRVANRLVYGRRATPYEVLSRFSSQVGETVATEETLEHMARLLAEGTGAARAQVWLKVGEQMRSAASWPEEAAPDFSPLVNANGSLPEFAEVDLAVPVSHDRKLLGALTITKKRGEPVSPVERSLIEDLAAQAGLVLRNVRLTADLRARLEELRDSRRRLVEAQDGERRRLERDLHDGAQQQLVALKIKLGLARRLAERDGAMQAAGLVDQLVEETDEAVAALRELAHGIYPPLLAAEGLEGALRARAAKAPLLVTIEADGVGRFSQEMEAAIYFCVLEAIQNAAKYANASRVAVRLAHSDGQLTFQVADDGVGFDPTTTPRGHGLTNIADRLDALGGHLTISSFPGEGTTITGQVPTARIAPLSAIS